MSLSTRRNFLIKMPYADAATISMARWGLISQQNATLSRTIRADFLARKKLKQRFPHLRIDQRMKQLSFFAKVVGAAYTYGDNISPPPSSFTRE